MRVGVLTFCCFFVPVGNAFADTTPSTDVVAWLNKIAVAAQQLNYSGTFVYQHGNHVETSRIIHFVDASGEHEKLVTLDGPPREIIRNNDEVMYFMPDSKTVKIEKRKARKSFPALLPTQLSTLAENYTIKSEHLVTVVGEAPAITVMQIGNPVSFKSK